MLQQKRDVESISSANITLTTVLKLIVYGSHVGVQVTPVLQFRHGSLTTMLIVIAQFQCEEHISVKAETQETVKLSLSQILLVG